MSTEESQTSCKTLTRRQLLKRGLYGGLTAGLAGSLSLSGCRSGKGRKPNVLIIVMDTARADRFSFTGYGQKTSPRTDALASESVVFERAYSADFWTLPSHAALFTGLYPSQTGATSETDHLPDSNTTLATVLQAASYDTSAFVCNAWVSKERGFAKGFDQFYEMWRSENYRQAPQGPGRAESAAVNTVRDWLEHQHKTSSKPFFVFINLNSPHLPYDPPEPYATSFVKPDCTADEINRLSKITGMWEHLAGELKLSERDLRIMSDLYDGEIAFTDHCVGQVIDCLKDLDSLDDTLVIITSDHGENIGEHGLIDHLLSMYETTLHVPLVVRYPTRFKAGTSSDGLVSLVDVFPTVLELCNLRSESEKLEPAGISFADADGQKRAFIVAENDRPLNGINLMKCHFPAFDTRTIDYRMRAIRTNKEKLIWKLDRGKELYDLQADPGELNNLAEQESQTCDKLNAILISWMKEMPSNKDATLMEGKDPESLKILRSLGYVE
jgi:arylsulfatase A-like enzyme